jgi:hypothetical protein
MATVSKLHPKQTAESLIAEALRQIAEEGAKPVFVRLDTVRSRSLEPTDSMQKTFRYIKEKGFVSFELSFGLHRGILGGLLARGILVETTQNGVRGYKVR